MRDEFRKALLKVTAVAQIMTSPVVFLFGMVASEMSRALSMALMAAAVGGLASGIGLLYLRRWAWWYSIVYHLAALPYWVVVVFVSARSAGGLWSLVGIAGNAAFLVALWSTRSLVGDQTRASS